MEGHFVVPCLADSAEGPPARGDPAEPSKTQELTSFLAHRTSTPQLCFSEVKYIVTIGVDTRPRGSLQTWEEMEPSSYSLHR